MPAVLGWSTICTPNKSLAVGSDLFSGCSPFTRRVLLRTPVIAEAALLSCRVVSCPLSQCLRRLPLQSACRVRQASREQLTFVGGLGLASGLGSVDDLSYLRSFPLQTQIGN
jgi:hypothetical protein